ncbi:Hypothetical predicted protein [Paramuricea clavata]|uniref:Uncharacterized protein n=1 Tax=Paramuricea clavata TaxID=317549 RepID=A0A7D9D5M4_PARCT|nr:Hypothetical predicted protein [Paramuricea clavata]
MSSKSSDSDRLSVSDDDSEFNYIPGNYSLIESEIMEASDSENGEGNKDQHTSCVDVERYSSEPMADEEWMAEYRLRQAEKEQRLASLKDRLAGKKSLSNWYTS